MSIYTKRKVTSFIVVHAAATRPSMDIGVKEVRQWHRAKGWVDVGYHYIIRRDGTVETGRPIDVVGAHVEGHNHYSVGICMAGGVSEKDGKTAEDNFTVEQKTALRQLIKHVLAIYPSCTVQGHRDFPNVRKDCPCFDTRKWWAGEAEPATCHTVEKGDTFLGILRKYKVDPLALIKANPKLFPMTLPLGASVNLPKT